MTDPYRVAGTVEVIPEAPVYLSKFDPCTHCDAIDAMLYPHTDNCPWWIAYLAAGRRMKQYYVSPPTPPILTWHEQLIAFFRKKI